MKINSHRSQLHTIRSGDPRFHIKDQYITSPRAGFEISQQCPKEYRMVLTECIDRGWLKPVAHLTERELLFIGLTIE